MPVVSNGNRLLQFGIFELDLKAGELRRNGSKVRLQEQPFQVLTVLLEQPGEVVSREELRNRLWPADTFVDFDHSLNAAIRRLREALGDSADSPRFVETVARRGYRFLVPVNGKPASDVLTSSTSTKPAASWVRAGLAVGAIALLVAVAFGWWLGHARSTVSRPSPSLRRLTANPADVPILSAVISPDGRYLAYSDRTGFYLRQIATGETNPVSLPDHFGGRPASWLVDGTHLVTTWAASPSDAPGLWNVSIMGGVPIKLTDDGNSPAVSPDGSQIAFLKGTASPKGGSSQEIWVMQADGGSPRKILSSDGALVGVPAWSPDGKNLAYAAGRYHGGGQHVDAELRVIEVATRRIHPLLSTVGLGSDLIWSVGNKLIYTISERPPNQDDSNLWEIQIDPLSLKPTSVPLRLTSDPGFVTTLSITSDGKRLAFFKHSIQPDVYVADLVNAGTGISAPRRLTLDERQDYPFAWSPDNKSVLFDSDRDGTFHIFKQAVERATPELLAGGNEQLVTPRLTPDRGTVLYLVTPKFDQTTNQVRMMRVPLAGGPPQLVLKADGLNNHQCSVLPANVCIFSSIQEGEIRFFRFDPLTGESNELPQLKRRETDYYSFNWSLSPDGTTLATSRKSMPNSDAAIRLISIADSSEILRPVPGWPFLNSLDWAADGKSIWVSASTTQDGSSLLNVPLNGRVRTIIDDQKMRVGWAIQSSDGKKLAIWQASGTSNVWMLENY